jgi:hypothetical protein
MLNRAMSEDGKPGAHCSFDDVELPLFLRLPDAAGPAYARSIAVARRISDAPSWYRKGELVMALSRLVVEEVAEHHKHTGKRGGRVERKGPDVERSQLIARTSRSRPMS